MAGAFTHIIISDIGKTRQKQLGTELFQLLNKHYRFLFLGSVSPDLPYLSLKTGGINWADVMHWEKTDSNFNIGYEELKTSWYLESEIDRAKLVWLMGYVSHMIADATIHPVVKEIVGEYNDETKDKHRICEMTQDSIIFFNHRNGEDIRYGEFADIVHYCKNSEHFEEFIAFWKRIMEVNYPEKGEEPYPELWFKTYSAAIDFADGKSVFAGLFRHVGPGKSFIYKTAEEIKDSEQDNYANYFEKVKLPGGTTANFEEVFEKAVNNVVGAWRTIYSGLTTNVVPVKVVKPWNLDTGIDMQSLSKEVTYWV
jgi:hypothetical protein